MKAGEGRADCSACEQRILHAEDPGDALLDASVSDHLETCTECREFFESLGEIKPVLDRYGVPEPPEALVETVIDRAFPVFVTQPIAEGPPVNAGMSRIFLAGLLSLPLVILINASMGWALYEMATWLLPRTIALYCVGLFVVWASMAVSSGYASLPLLRALMRKPSGRFPLTADR